MNRERLPPRLVLSFSLVAVGCGDATSIDGDDEVGDESGGSTAESGDSGDPPLDPVPCAAQSGCSVDADCCPDPNIACGPDESWPNRWSCVSGECINLGCETGECPANYVCAEIDGLAYCLQPCATNTDCDEAGNGVGMTVCTGVAEVGMSQVGYCQEPAA